MQLVDAVRGNCNLAVELEVISRSTDLHALESIITNGRRTFLEVGTALIRIREAKLYKMTHSSWESWCQDKWWASKRHADRQIAAVQLVMESNRLGHDVPTAEHARELARAPVEARHLVVAEAQSAAEADGVASPTVRHMREAVDRVTDTKANPARLQTRRTPRWLFDFLDDRFGPFQLDAFAEPNNALCDNFYTKEQDGSVQPWADVTFGNPEFEDMTTPLFHAVRQAEVGVRSCIIGPVGCSQTWYHELAIRGTVYVPDIRINFDLPDGTPTNRADRDTIVMCFGGEHENKHHKRGTYRVCRLELSR